MRILSHALCITLLATLSVVEAGAETLGFEVTAGEVKLVFSSREVSSLPLDIDAIAERQCGADNTPLGKCVLKVGTGGGITGEDIPTAVSSPIPLGDGNQTLPLKVAGLGILSLESVESSCGTWEVSLIFDSIDSQPSSPMILQPSAQNPGQGVLASVLRMRLLLRVVNQSTAQTVDYPLELGIVLGGSWALSSSSTPSSGSSDRSNLALFPDRQYQCFPVVLLNYPVVLLNEPEECQFCFEGRSESHAQGSSMMD